MKHVILGLACATACLAAVPVAGQNRTEQQILLELRTLQEQVQRLQLAVNVVTDQVKAAEGRIGLDELHHAGVPRVKIIHAANFPHRHSV